MVIARNLIVEESKIFSRVVMADQDGNNTGFTKDSIVTIFMDREAEDEGGDNIVSTEEIIGILFTAGGLALGMVYTLNDSDRK
jgi:hypothetical protein